MDHNPSPSGRYKVWSTRWITKETIRCPICHCLCDINSYREHAFFCRDDNVTAHQARQEMINARKLGPLLKDLPKALSESMTD